MDDLNVRHYRFGGWRRELGHYPPLDGGLSLGHRRRDAFEETVSLIFHLIQAWYIDAGDSRHLTKQLFS